MNVHTLPNLRLMMIHGMVWASATAKVETHLVWLRKELLFSISTIPHN
jgi:hypothetical protein